MESVVLNGTSLDPATHWADSRIALAGLAADNELTVEATGHYTNTGEGMHRFVDPVDGEVYLYSQFEVPDSRRVFPVFEQPDLKATFAFTVTTPAGWTVRSVSPTPEPVAAGERDGCLWSPGRSRRRRGCPPTSPPSSPGPTWASPRRSQSRKGPVELGLWARRSLMEYLDADNLFDVTKKGFEFFEREFDSEYPFAKYDQIFTPEYNAGAMENAGCVTISELYMFRGKVNDPLVERRALTVLHELAHMWFGDLVTMQWWDDLWLNESFAEWASTLAQAEATHWTGAWTTFQSHEKTWAYQQDQLPSTHPVYADIRDLDDVLVNFDGITYAKGGSILKQLVAYVGREPAHGAAGLLPQARLGQHPVRRPARRAREASGRDLGRWSDAVAEDRRRQHPGGGGRDRRGRGHHLGRRGADRHRGLPDAASASDRHRPLRPRRRGARARRPARARHRRGPHQVPELVGHAQPELLLPNDDDLSYAKLRFDERSYATASRIPLTSRRACRVRSSSAPCGRWSARARCPQRTSSTCCSAPCTWRRTRSSCARSSRRPSRSRR